MNVDMVAAKADMKLSSPHLNHKATYISPKPPTRFQALMDANYITACVQKAAALRKHDVKLWFGYSKRILAWNLLWVWSG